MPSLLVCVVLPRNGSSNLFKEGWGGDGGEEGGEADKVGYVKLLGTEGKERFRGKVEVIRE